MKHFNFKTIGLVCLVALSIILAVHPRGGHEASSLTKLTNLYQDNSNRLVRDSQIYLIEEDLKIALGEAVIEELAQQDPEVYREVLLLLQRVPDFRKIIEGLAVGSGNKFVQKEFKTNPIVFIKKLRKISKLPGFVKVVNGIKNVWNNEYIKAHFKFRDLYVSPLEFQIPSEFPISMGLVRFGPTRKFSRSKYLLFALKLSLGPDYVDAVLRRAPYIDEIDNLIDSLKKIPEVSFYRYIGKLANFLGKNVVELSGALKIFKETYKLLDSSGVEGRNILLSLPFLLAEIPTVEELKSMRDLDFEVEVSRIQKYKRWFIIMGTEDLVAPIEPEEMGDLIGDVQWLDVSIHNHPKRSRPTDTDFRAANSLHNFVIINDGVFYFIWGKEDTTKFIPWSELRIETYNP